MDRYLSGKSPNLSVHYLAYSLSYETLSQLERLDPSLSLAICEGDWWSRQDTAGGLVEKRREAARADCADWRSWTLSACLAAGGG